MKAHIGVDARTSFTYSLETTAANEQDLNHADALLHGDERFICADVGYRRAKNGKNYPMTMLSIPLPSAPHKRTRIR